MNERAWEKAVIDRMTNDGWEDIPKDGDNMLSAMWSIVRYIDKIRQDRDWYASDLYRNAKQDGNTR